MSNCPFALQEAGVGAIDCLREFLPDAHVTLVMRVPGQHDELVFTDDPDRIKVIGVLLRRMPAPQCKDASP